MSHNNQQALDVATDAQAAIAHQTPTPKPEQETSSTYHRPTAHSPSPDYLSTKSLTICLAEEPTSLYILSEGGRGWGHIQEALRDGPFEQRMFNYQPVILEKIPHWENGDVWLTPVIVHPGEAIVTVEGRIVNLEAGVRYWTPELKHATARAGDAVTTIQMHVRFRLRPDVRWSNGETLTAEDSVFGYQVAADPDTPTPKALAWRTSEYVAVGPHTVEWTGVAGFFNHDYVLSFAEPLSMHAYEHLRPEEMLTDQQVNRRPIGWGAFRVADWVDGSHILLVRNELYFRTSEGLPYLDEVRFVFVETETETIARLDDGSCHIAVRNQWDAWEASVYDLLTAQSAQRIILQFVPGPMLEHIDFGMTPATEYHREAGTDILESIEMRQAIAHCIDRQALADAIQWGKGTVAHSYVPPNHPLYGGDQLTMYAFDPSQGQALLTAASWVPDPLTGIRHRDGIPLILRYSTSFSRDYSGRLRQILAELIQSDLLECGIELSVELSSAADIYSEWPKGIIFGRKFDLAEYTWLLPGEPRCELYRSDQIPNNSFPGGINSAGYSSHAFDAACDQGFLALEHTQEAQGHLVAQKIFTADLPSLPLLFRLRIGVSRPELTGFQIDPTHPSPLWNIEAFDLVSTK